MFTYTRKGTMHMKKNNCTVSAEHAHVLLSATPCDLQGCMGSGVRFSSKTRGFPWLPTSFMSLINPVLKASGDLHPAASKKPKVQFFSPSYTCLIYCSVFQRAASGGQPAAPALLSSLHLSHCLFHCQFSGLWVSWAVLVQVGVHFIF